MRRIIAVVDWVEGQRRKPPVGGRGSQILPQADREFELAEELGPNSTADAYPTKYIGNGDTCEPADFESDTTRTFKIGGGRMKAFRERTFAAGTIGQCRKDPGRNWWTILQIDCEPEIQ